MIIVDQVLETRCLSSLEKVFADENLTCKSIHQGSALLNETFSFQVAYRNNQSLFKGITVDIESDIKDLISVRSVGLVPSELPCYHDHDDHILRSAPGLYPDPLYPLDSHGIVGFPNQWRSIWVMVELNEKVKSGIHDIKVIFKSEEKKDLGQEIFKLEVIPVKLPEQKLIHTEWLHVDCLATEYNLEIFSEKHWEMIDKYVETMAKHGINMIYTPLFTPPLDTEIGKERPTVQLVDVNKEGNMYHFSFDKLMYWIELCAKRGIEYFEFSHLFTQWGAKHAPKILATEDGELNKIFGWETDAAGEEYTNFLSQFLPELIVFIKEQNLEKYVYFHISDEPTLEHLDSYKKASDIIYKYLHEYPIMDALSDYEFYEKGYVKHPIPSNDKIEPFIENEVQDLWTYYCCVQYKDVSNRFFNFSSSRNRVLGMQLFKYDIKGFLHWGYNFWYSQFSKKVIDPFLNTDADFAFASGDSYLVYPGESGPIESIRLEVFFEALQDLRALQLLESKIGKDQVIELLEQDIEQPLTFSKYPQADDWLLNKREAINKKISEEFIK